MRNNVNFVDFKKMFKKCFIIQISQKVILFVLLTFIILLGPVDHWKTWYTKTPNLVMLNECGCMRQLSKFDKINERLSPVKYNETTCSKLSSMRGSGQKVIGFSIFGNFDSWKFKVEKKYFEGIKGNLNLLQKYYPGWIIRIYYNFSNREKQHKSLCQIACSNDNIDLCPIQKLPNAEIIKPYNILPYIWRFIPTLDPQVDVFLSRDLDSRFSFRELDAVNEWLESNKTIHVMRDHPQHNTPILAGLWGSNMKINNAREKWKKSWKKILLNTLLNPKMSDQAILTQYVWDWAKYDLMQHDSYFCHLYRNTSPFPTKRIIEPNNFVGSVKSLYNTLFDPCPELCRKYIEWKYC